VLEGILVGILDDFAGIFSTDKSVSGPFVIIITAPPINRAKISNKVKPREVCLVLGLSSSSS